MHAFNKCKLLNFKFEGCSWYLHLLSKTSLETFHLLLPTLINLFEKKIHLCVGWRLIINRIISFLPVIIGLCIKWPFNGIGGNSKFQHVVLNFGGEQRFCLGEVLDHWWHCTAMLWWVIPCNASITFLHHSYDDCGFIRTSCAGWYVCDKICLVTGWPFHYSMLSST